MTEYLEKAALVRILRAKAEMGRLSEYSVCFDNVAKMIELLPAADVEEVKHGHVITIFKSTFEQYEPSIYGCSVCKCRITRDSKFCKHCGAKMLSRCLSVLLAESIQ